MGSLGLVGSTSLAVFPFNLSLLDALPVQREPRHHGSVVEKQLGCFTGLKVSHPRYSVLFFQNEFSPDLGLMQRSAHGDLRCWADGSRQTKNLKVMRTSRFFFTVVAVISAFPGENLLALTS